MTNGVDDVAYGPNEEIGLLEHDIVVTALYVRDALRSAGWTADLVTYTSSMAGYTPAERQ
ncbi:MAG: hypothetical protein GIX03_00015 [Candidatus Eremiobacteraeota bacterium]|nr:hypothetical protein [Candidatus Eremiobacteraeota bacterium]MBC5801407.1 hypothetical protein [Candidatus Eremiobacteraeota bacterium]